MNRNEYFCILQYTLPLTCYRIFFLLSFYHILFMTEKYAKGPGTAKTVATAFRSCRYGEHSAGSCFSQTTFRSAIGDKRTRFPRNNNNANMHRSNSFYPVSAVWTVVCCVLDSAGGFRKLPVREKRPPQSLRDSSPKTGEQFRCTQ